MKHLKTFESFSINEEIGLLGLIGALGFTAVLGKVAEFALDFIDSREYQKNWGKYETGETKTIIYIDKFKDSITFKVIEKEGKKFYSTKVKDVDENYSKRKKEVADRVFVYNQEQFDKLLSDSNMKLDKTKSEFSYTPPQLFKRYYNK